MRRDLEDRALPIWLNEWREDLEGIGWGDILLGNGASISVDPGFRYASLYDVAAARRALDAVDLAFFEELDTTDFESVLAMLGAAERVNALLNLPTAKVQTRYQRIRRALCDSVNAVHPLHGDVEYRALRNANVSLSSFQRCFTTNYDLLLYWSMMTDIDAFLDFFWSFGGTYFSRRRVDVFATNANRTQVYYLHGGLMLFQDEDGDVWKLKADGNDLLSLITERILKGETPVFVSEGTAKQKLAAIKRHSYLEFALSKLESSRDNLVVYGNSLQGTDLHIIDAIRRSGRDRVAISLYPSSREHLNLERARFRKLLRPIDPDFFDARTFDLYSPDHFDGG